MSVLIDIIIPTVPGREDDLERCLASYTELTTASHRFIIRRDSPTSGEGWLWGLERSNAPYVHLACDDLEVTGGEWAEECIEAVERGYLPCPVVCRPDGTCESFGGDMAAPDCLLPDPVPDWTLVDFTTVPFMSRTQAQQIGMLPIQYCSDVWVSYRGRQLGYETVVRLGYEFVHYQSQVRRGAGMTQFERAQHDRRIMETELAAVTATVA